MERRRKQISHNNDKILQQLQRLSKSAYKSQRELEREVSTVQEQLQIVKQIVDHTDPTLHHLLTSKSRGKLSTFSLSSFITENSSKI